eukprot:TRINITY_DN34_c0_g2_i1.p1 TRINITY_DN34_c0_g2~~TRINITY_DN34_c0_g2_i1.p1  ORF type:complete len:51 (-),score=2.92 TRINITY_DN34_c0_g2_i1:95-247(-)
MLKWKKKNKIKMGNPGIEFDLSWVLETKINKSAVNDRAEKKKKKKLKFRT